MDTSSYKEKLELYKDIRHKLKKKKIFLDESKEGFGFKMRELVDKEKVRNTDEIKGYPLLVKLKLEASVGLKVALKVVPIETKYNKHEHPIHLESIFLSYLTEDLIHNYISPNITYYLYDFKSSNRSRALRFLNLKMYEKRELIKSSSNILVSEYVTGGNLGEWVYNKYNRDNSKISDILWKSIVFQLIYTIFIFGDKYKMMHNDFHYGNILIDDSLTPGGYFQFTLVDKNNGTEKNWYLPNQGIIPKIWDFEFAMVYSNKIKDAYPNQFILANTKFDRQRFISVQNSDDFSSSDLQNVPIEFNKVYDLHYFLTSLLDLYISKELFDWIIDLYPSELIPEDTDTLSDTTRSTRSTSTGSAGRRSTRSNQSTRTSTSTGASGESTFTGSSTENSYLREGRLINGIEKSFPNLPLPIDILQSDFFKVFRQKPSDFNSSNSISFKY